MADFESLVLNVARVYVAAVLLTWCPIVHMDVNKDTFHLCVYGDNFGRRSGQFCYVFLFKQDYEKPFRWAEAVNFCRHVGILAEDFLLSDLNFLPGKPDKKEAFTGLKTQESRCHGNVTNFDECLVVCKIATCPQGTFDPPKCLSTCQCKQLEYCDVITGACKNEKCSAGFYGPPFCWQSCSCLHDVTCDAVDGFCPFGCKQGWTGTDCKTRRCPLGFAGPPKCDHKCHCEKDKDCDVMSGSCEHGCADGWSGINCSKPCQAGADNCGSCFCSDPNCKDPPGVCKCDPGWGGKLCTNRKCPIGTFGPPDCQQTCHCEDDRFCGPSDGHCHGTPCEDRWLGTNCQDRACDPGYFGPPLCLFRCHCANDTCDHKDGICAQGCKQGWHGNHCNVRLCPEGTFGMPRCDRACRCLSNLSCNAVTGGCEGGACLGQFTGSHCNISAPNTPFASRYRTHSKPSDIVTPFVVVLAIAGGWFGFTVCVPPARGKRGEMKSPDVPRQETDGPVSTAGGMPLSNADRPQSSQKS